jgi:hypothetical protein
MRVIGHFESRHLKLMEERGYTPESAHGALVKEGARRFGVPAHQVMLTKNPAGGWDIVLLAR